MTKGHTHPKISILYRETYLDYIEVLVLNYLTYTSFVDIGEITIDSFSCSTFMESPYYSR